ncbi:hypothetical protein [Chryseobacterium taichungense]|uniref:hypothetical protein n=1 Tax=Chryseobacterium taichungense TaxID=295069 RepID=UPI000B801E21|nr:hypothetical protein [Chryseobacterium taichungense]
MSDIRISSSMQNDRSADLLFSFKSQITSLKSRNSGERKTFKITAVAVLVRLFQMSDVCYINAYFQKNKIKKL